MKKDTVLWARQYSKRLITFLLVAWAIGAVIGVAYEFARLISDPTTASMDALYIYLAVPLTCGIPSYVIPNVFLNKEKVRQHYIQNYDYSVLGNGYATEEIVDQPEESQPAFDQIPMDSALSVKLNNNGNGSVDTIYSDCGILDKNSNPIYYQNSN